MKTVRVETAEAIADALLELGYAVQHRPGPLDLGHIVADTNSYQQLKPVLDSLIVDDERWIHVLAVGKRQAHPQA